VIGPAYELTPDGATFTPAIRLTITYDPADLPTGLMKPGSLSQNGICPTECGSNYRVPSTQAATQFQSPSVILACTLCSLTLDRQNLLWAT